MSSSVRFESMILRDYGVFSGSNELEFDHHRTTIVGPGGSGRTTIARALLQVGAAPGVQRHHQSGSTDFGVQVITKGDPKLVIDHPDLVLVSDDTGWVTPETLLAKAVRHDRWEAVRTQAGAVFQNLLRYKPWKIDRHRELTNMAAGEQACLSLALVFAVRAELGVDLPVVFDSAFGRLDLPLMQGVMDFLSGLAVQQVFLVNEYELMEGGPVNYRLKMSAGSSRIVRASQ